MMKNILRNSVASALLLLGLVVLPTATASAAVNPLDQGCAGVTSDLCAKKNDTLDTPINNIIRLLIWAIGVISVIVIIVGGIKYTTSNGDPSKVKSAKDTILYAVIGLVVAVLAYAIVAFVLSSV